MRCRICKKTFVSSFLVTRHMKTVHNEDKMKKCDCCGQKFRFWQGLKTHKCPNGYTSRQPVICDICGDILGCEEYLKSHKLRKHEGVKFDKRRYRKFVFCEICGKQMYKDHLKTHMNIHLNIKPYACTYCSKAFVSKGRLDEHVRTHTGHRPYICDICGKGFTQRHCVKTHKESVHGKEAIPAVW